MKEMMPRDIIAIILIIGGLLLIFSGKDGVIGTLLAMVATFYFGADFFEERKRGN